MRAGLLGRDCGELIGGRGAEGPARGGEHDTAYAGAAQRPRSPGGKALEDGVVLAVDRQELRAAVAHGVQEQTPGHHQRLFVGEQHALARSRCGQAGLETGGTDDGGHHRVDLRERGDSLQGARTRQHLGREAGRTHAALEQIGAARIHQHGILGSEADALLEHPLDLAVRGKRSHAEAVRMPRYHVERARADRPSRPEDGELAWRHVPWIIHQDPYSG